MQIPDFHLNCFLHSTSILLHQSFHISCLKTPEGQTPKGPQNIQICRCLNKCIARKGEHLSKTKMLNLKAVTVKDKNVKRKICRQLRISLPRLEKCIEIKHVYTSLESRERCQEIWWGIPRVIMSLIHSYLNKLPEKHQHWNVLNYCFI